ncbi:aspartyl/asparaginyl beta-hydroxylase domain-containing protein [Sphingomonas sp. ASY06-1R]|jgi:aspartyl/asparaginyl beta-hydroxylase (cupin superfamily)|uniref:aspartyl/asparaginyl beta-hydroxylase domain-containing protein n=1 Tax=Sphingomonas sp. ASY06-1R TaxID=3445771 RepID=UPI003FA1EC11
MADIAPQLMAAMETARAAQRAGRLDEAVAILEAALSSLAPHPAALNQLGLCQLAAGRPLQAAAIFRDATALDPNAPPLWLNLADAHRRADARADEIAALDRALGIDPYLLPALLAKGAALEALGEADAAAKVYRGLLASYPDLSAMPDAVQGAVGRARDFVDQVNRRTADALMAATASTLAAYPDQNWRRANTYLAHLSGQRRIYPQQPVAGHFPFLPADEYFEDHLFPWLGALEQATDMIRGELLARWAEGADRPAPYVDFPEGAPVNQWADLNRSPRWGAYFLWRDGVPQAENLARCPGTAALLERLPILDLPGKGPTALFSILDAHTHIPPHTGSTNIRGTVHLPLVLPGQCRFRVGGETRDWQMNKAWVFDDTIEHEAWNDSDQPRAILIFDCWNPHLTAAERALVRASGG